MARRVGQVAAALRPIADFSPLGPADHLRLRATGTIRRSDFGLEWEALREAGRLLVADDVRLLADVVLRRS